MASSDSAPSPRLSLPALLGFSTPGVCIGALAIALGVFLPHYYARHFGLGLAAVGLAFGAVRLIDTAFDPFIGVIMDKTRSRLGRYRLWLAGGAPVLMVAVFMLFDPPTAVSAPYLIGWLFVYYIGTSLIMLSHASWASVVAGRYHERSRVFGAIQLVSVVGATVTLTLPIIFAGPHPPGGLSDVGAMGWFVIISAPVGVALALLSTPERVIAHQGEERFGPRDYLDLLLRPDMLRIVVADFCLALGPGWMSALYLFYFQDARGFARAPATELLFIYVASGIIGAAGLSWLATRLGKHRTLMLASTGYSLGLLILPFLPRAAFAPTAAVMAFQGFLAAGFPLLDRAMVADVADAVRLEKGKHRVGLLYSMITTVQKVAGALSITLSYSVLGLIGYQPREGAVNTAHAIAGMQIVYLSGPVFFVMLGGACYIGYKLDSKRHADIRAQLEERDAMSPGAPILESLSGEQTTPTHIADPA